MNALSFLSVIWSHHSNQTSWLETVADVAIIEPDEEGLVNLDHLTQLLEQYKDRKTKIAAITSCSNVTGIKTPYYAIAKMLHSHGGYCFVDFACSAPYIDINMRPEDPLEHLDAIYFSPQNSSVARALPAFLYSTKNCIQTKSRTTRAAGL